MLTIRPQRRSIMPGRNAWASLRTALKLIANDSSHTPSAASIAVGREPPALLMRMSTWQGLVTDLRGRRAVGEIDGQGVRTHPSRAFDLVLQRLQQLAAPRDHEGR